MTFAQLSYFLAVCENGNNMTKASEQCHISQPALSKAVACLEEEFGCKLFYRDGKKLHKTGEGDRVFVLAQQLLKHISTVEEKVETYLSGLPTIRIAVDLEFGAFFIPQIIVPFIESNPDMLVEVSELPSMEIKKGMESRALDAAITNLALYKEDKYTLTPLCESYQVYAMRPEHPLAGKAMVTRGEMLRYPILTKPKEYTSSAKPWDAWPEQAVKHTCVKQRDTAFHLMKGDVGYFCSNLSVFDRENICYARVYGARSDMTVGAVCSKQITANNKVKCLLKHMSAAVAEFKLEKP